MRADITVFVETEPRSLPEETLGSLVLVDAAVLRKTFIQVNFTSCPLEPIPSSLLGHFMDLLQLSS